MNEKSESAEGIRQILIESGLVSAEKLDEISKGSDSKKLGQLLVEHGVITAKELAMVVGLQMNVPCVNLSTYQIQPEALQLIPEAMARKYNVIPLTISDNALQVATADIDDFLSLEALAAKSRMRIEPVVAPADEIREAIDRNYKSFGEIAAELDQVAPTETVEDKISVEAIARAPVVRALDLLIKEAIKNRASDIHIEPEGDRLLVRYRIDGVLNEAMTLPISVHPALISRLKILANMNIADHRPQDGQFSTQIEGKDVDIRVATIYTTHGEMGVLRVLDKSFAALTLSELGFLPNNLQQYEQMMKSPFGMILISGPTGSGKTTSLYASINHLDNKSRKIITVEDPVEYKFRGISQIQVSPRAGLTFASGLRAIMRHDPDVILVGEIRDSETAEIAVQAALTGHLVLSSVHANNSVGAIFRLLDLGIGPFLVTSALVGVVAQRMVRKVCPYCQQSMPAPTEPQLAYNDEVGEKRIEFIYGTGCNSCANTGYLGRTAVFEILTMSEAIRTSLLTGASSDQIMSLAKKEGMATMWRDGMLKVKAGITTPDEVLRSVFSVG